MPRRRFELHKADSLIHSILKDLNMEEGVRFYQINSKWHDMFQEPVSMHMSPSALNDGELLINVDSPVWLHEMSYHKAEMLKRLSPFGVKDIRLRIGRLLKGTKRKSASVFQQRPLRPDERAFIIDITSSINDKELSEVIRRAVENSFLSKGEAVPPKRLDY